MWGVCGRCTEISCRPPNTYSWTLHLSYPHTLPCASFRRPVPWFFRRCPITKSIHDAASAKLAMEDLVDAEGKGGESGDTTVKTLEATTTTQAATEVVQSRLKAQEVVEEKRAADEAAAAKREAESKELNARRSSLSSVEGSVVAMAKAQSEAKVEDVPVVVEASEPTAEELAATEAANKAAEEAATKAAEEAAAQLAAQVKEDRKKAQEVVEEKRAADEAAAAKREAESKELNARRSSLSSVEGSVVAMAKAQSEAKVEDVPVVVEASEPTHAVEEPTYMPVGEAAFTLEQLASGGTANNVDPTKKELYLSDAEFADVFKMDKAAWEKQPKWKRVQEKKKKGIF